MDQLADLVELLGRPDVSEQAAEIVAGMSGNADFLVALRGSDELRVALCDVVKRKDAGGQHSSLVCLVNLASESEEYGITLVTKDHIIESCARLMLDQAGSPLEVVACLLLTNVTRTDIGASELATVVEKDPKIGDRLVRRLVQAKAPFADDLNHIANIIGNLGQVPAGRAVLLKERTGGEGSGSSNNKRLIHQLIQSLPSDSGVRWLGVLSSIKNCAFDNELHSPLVDCDDQLAVILGLPLCGGGRPLSDQDKQYLPQKLIQAMGEGTKENNSLYDSTIRKTALEATVRLCGSKVGREYFKQYRIYPCIREKHLLEEDAECIELMEWFVDYTMIREEEGAPPTAIPTIEELEAAQERDRIENGESKDSKGYSLPAQESPSEAEQIAVASAFAPDP